MELLYEIKVIKTAYLKIALLFVLLAATNISHANELPQGWYKYKRPGGEIRIIQNTSNSYCLEYQKGKGGVFFINAPFSPKTQITVSANLIWKKNSSSKTGGQAYLYLYDINGNPVGQSTANIKHKFNWQRVTFSLENISKLARKAQFGLSVSSEHSGTTCVDIDSLKWSKGVMKKSSKINLYTRTWGKRSSPAIILIHGNNQDGMVKFSWLAYELSRNFFVIAYDQRGFGSTKYSGKDYSFESQKRDLDEVINRYKLDKYSLLGHSFGARIAVAYASSHPQETKAIILEDMDIFSRQLDVFKYANGNPLNCTGQNQMEIWGCVANLTDLRSAFKAYSGKILILQSDDKNYIALSNKNLKKMKQIHPSAQIVQIKNSSHFIHYPKNHLDASQKMKSLVIKFLK